MNIIKVENLVKYYGEFQAIKNINFELNKNEALGLLGLNGAGKTTVLRILSGYLIPSSGKININGLDIHENPLAIKKKLGYLPETPPLYNELSVDEYLIFVAGIKGVEQGSIDKLLSRAISKAGLEKVHGRLIKELSLGFRKRVGIAQAIIAIASCKIRNSGKADLSIEKRSDVTLLQTKVKTILSGRNRIKTTRQLEPRWDQLRASLE